MGLKHTPEELEVTFTCENYCSSGEQQRLKQENETAGRTRVLVAETGLAT